MSVYGMGDINRCSFDVPPSDLRGSVVFRDTPFSTDALPSDLYRRRGLPGYALAQKIPL